MNMNLKNVMAVTLTSLFLTACGGGGGGGSTPTNPPTNPPTTPTNNAPVLSVSTSYVNMIEGDSAVVELKKEDKDSNDSLSYEVINSTSDLNVSIEGNELIIEANQVNLTTNHDIVVELTDTKTTVSKRISVVINDLSNNSFPQLGLEKTAITMSENSTSNVNLNGADAEQDSLEYSIINDNNEIETNLNSNVLTITSKEVTETEEFELILIVNDGKNESEQLIKVIVNNSTSNNLPKIELSENNVFMKEKETVSINITGSDEDGDNLTYGVIGNNNVSVTIDGGLLTIEAKRVNTDLITSVTALVNDGTNTTSKDITVNIENVPNTPPTLSLSKSELELEVSESDTVFVTVDDIDGDTNLSKTVSSNNQSVAIVEKTESGFEVTGVDNGVAIITYTVRDSENGTASENLTVTVSENTPPVVVLNPSSVTIDLGRTQFINATITDSENDEVNSSISISNSRVSAALVEGGLEITGVNIGESVVTYTVTDDGGLSSEAELVVTVIESTNEAPDFSLSNEVGNNQVRIYHDRESVLNVNIVDPDSTAHSLVMTGFKATSGTVDVIKSYFVNSSNKTITFETNALPSNIDTMVFEMEIIVTDDSNNSVSKIYEMFVEKSANTPPTFTFSDKVGAFVMVNQNGSTDITYTIQDDNASNVEVTGLQYWYGDQSKFNVTLDAGSQSITVNTTNVEVEDAYGVVLTYVDSSITGTVNIELLVKAPFGEAEQEMRELKNKMLKARESVKEYVYVGAFYAQVLENLGYITQQQAEDFIEELDVDDSNGNQYSIFNLYVGNIEYYISIGEFQDPSFKDSYITVLNNLLSESETVGSSRYTIVNEMSAISDGLLPEVSFERDIQEYDTENNYFSRFVGNTAYGEMVDGVWVFDQEFKFMNGVLAQMNENAQRNIDSE